MLSGIDINEALNKYGLFPCLFGNEAPMISWLIYYCGIMNWLFFLMLSNAAVSRITYKELKGDSFFSINDAISFALKKWKTVFFIPISIITIIISLIIFNSIFSLITTIPVIGIISFPILYVFYLSNALLIVFSTLALIISFYYAPIIIGINNEDTVGGVFQSFRISFNQPTRIIIYNMILIPISILFTNIYSWFYNASFNIIQNIFSFFNDEKIEKIFNYANSILDFSWIKNITKHSQDFIIDNSIINLPTHLLDLLKLIGSISYGVFELYFNALPNFTISNIGFSLNVPEIISGIILSSVLILIIFSILSYGFTIISVGQTISYLIFIKLTDDENLILTSTKEEDIEDKKVDFNNSSHLLLNSRINNQEEE